MTQTTDPQVKNCATHQDMFVQSEALFPPHTRGRWLLTCPCLGLTWDRKFDGQNVLWERSMFCQANLTITLLYKRSQKSTVTKARA